MHVQYLACMKEKKVKRIALSVHHTWYFIIIFAVTLAPARRDSFFLLMATLAEKRKIYQVSENACNVKACYIKEVYYGNFRIWPDRFTV